MRRLGVARKVARDGSRRNGRPARRGVRHLLHDNVRSSRAGRTQPSTSYNRTCLRMGGYGSTPRVELARNATTPGQSVRGATISKETRSVVTVQQPATPNSGTPSGQSGIVGGWSPCAGLVVGPAVGFSLATQEQYTASAKLLFRDPGLDQKLFGTTFLAPSRDPTREAATNVKLVSLDVVAERTARAGAKSAGATGTWRGLMRRPCAARLPGISGRIRLGGSIPARDYRDLSRLEGPPSLVFNVMRLCDAVDRRPLIALSHASPRTAAWCREVKSGA